MQTGTTQAVKRIPFFDTRVENPADRAEILAAIDVVLQHGRLVLGPEVQEFERRIAARVGRKHAVAVSSGTTAVWLGLRAAGVNPGDEVITTPLSWVATANAIAVAGAVPVFADIRDDLNLDPASLEPLITPRTRAILPVHYTGKVCDMDAIAAIAERHGLIVVEDAAQAFDATWRGRLAGSFGTVGCFSMNAMKVFAACGDAGVVVTDSEEIAQRLVRLRYNGTINREVCVDAALNGRIDPLQAAVLLTRLPKVAARIEKRRELAAMYTERLDGVVDVPRVTSEQQDVWYTYQIKVPRRDELMAFLDSRGVESRIQHPALMPDQPVYQSTRRECPNAQRLVRQILCLPLNERFTVNEIDYVVAAVREFHGQA